MKTKKKTVTLLLATLGVGAALLTGVAINQSFASAKAPYGDAFDYTQSIAPVKYKTLQSDASNPSKKGLLLYAYDSGASAEFKGSFNGEFKASLKPISEGNNPDLVKYSLVFKDRTTGKQFSVTVAGSGSYNDVYVTVDGESAGIHYFEDQWSGSAYGYTAAYNKAGAYTRFADGGEAEIFFNPQTMQVYVMGDNGAYRLVWDFSQEYNDGRLLNHDLTRFGEYTVDVVFDEVKTNGKGELLVYSFGEYTFNKAFMDSKPSISAEVKANAIVGKEYFAPTAKAFDLIQGELPSQSVSLTIYDNYGAIVNNNGAYAFTPDKAGEYYLYYTCGEGETKSSAFYRIYAIEEGAVTESFSYDVAMEDTISLGVQSTTYLPVAEVSSTLSADGYSVAANLTVKKDGAVVDGYENCAGGFKFTFTDAGTYQFIYQTDAFGVTMSETKTVTVSKDIANIIVEEIAKDVKYMSTISLKPAKIYYDGEVIDSEVTLVAPSGKTMQTSECLLDELGYYTIIHEYNGETFSQTFAVRQYYSDLFVSDASSVQYDVMDSNHLVKGQMLSLANDDVLTYNKVLDFSDNTFDDSLEDKSQNTPFIELYMQPKAIGMVDLAGFYVILTDATDPTNYIEIRMQYLSYLPNCMRIRTRASGQSWVGYDYNFWTGEVSVDSAQSHSDGGTIVPLNPGHTITNRQFTSASLKLYFDNEKGCLYTKTWQEKAGNSTEENIIPIPWLIRDFKTNDRFLSAEDTPWKGFASGQVYLSVYATGVTDTAELMVLSIDGEDLTQQFVADTTAPVISINTKEELPYAEVGTPFKLFDFTAIDGYASVVESGVKVYRGATELSVENGAFIPNSVGKYTIVYTAKDSFGNVATKEVVVEAKNSISNPEIAILGDFPDVVSFGDVLHLPEYYGYGGAGNVEVKVRVTAIDTGVEMPVKYGQFVCLQEGDYMVEYIATDYIGNTTTSYQWIYGVSRQQTPVFDESLLVLPKTFISGDAYKFGEYTAIYYTANGTAEEIKASITVTDANGTDLPINGAYLPKSSETVQSAIVKFIFEKSATKKTVIEKEIPILTIQQGQLGFLSKFFVGENAEVEAKNDAIYFTASAGKTAQYSFIKTINEKYLTLNFKRNDVKSFNTTKITLRDIYDADAVVTLTFINTQKGLTCSINGGKSSTANYDSAGKFGFTYDATTGNIVDVLGMKIGAIATYANGETFEGFPSGAVYLDFETDGCVGLSLISNQTFNNYIRDAITPRITVNGSFTGSYVPGQKIVLPTASAYDVLSAIGEIKLMVRTEAGETLLSTTADKENVFIPDDYGTYAVVYTVTDSSGNKISVSTSLIVVDDIKPTLTFNGDIPETAAWGSTMQLPTYIVNDNGDLTKATVKVYVCAPDGIMTLVKDGKVTFTRKGEYTIYYFVLDENNNPTNYTFYIQVN